MPDCSLPKCERLCSRRLTEKLFSGFSSSMTVFPLRAVFMELTDEQSHVPVAVLVSVSKRKMHHAVDRNRMKRQIREAYRLNKYLLVSPLIAQGRQMAVAFIALAAEPCSSAHITSSMRKLLKRIAEKQTP